MAGGANGYTHGLEFVFTTESYARLVAAYGTDVDALSNTEVAPYADNYFQYDDQLRVTEEIAQGTGCSTCAGGLGTFTFSYTASGNSPGYNSWATKTVETLPDGNENIVYTNAYGEVMLSVYYDTTADQKWDTFYEYDSQGRCILMADPSAVTGYNDSYADLLHNVSGSYADLSSSSGLITLYDYYTSTTATATTAGGIAGFQQDVQIEQGQSGTPIPQETWTYFTRTGGSVEVGAVATDTVYRNDDGTGAETTSFGYTWFSGTVQPQSVTVSLPVISSGQNGPDTADVSTVVFDSYGNPIWTKDADGYLTYTAYDTATGAVTETITDVDTCDSSDYSNKPSGWTTPTGGGLNLVTTYQVDALGRTTKETDPNGNVTYTVYDDVDHEVRVYQGWNSGTDMPTGPTLVTREDWADGYTETLTMSATPSVTSGVPNGTEAISDIQSLERDYANDAGQVVTVDQYFDLSGLSYSTGAMGTAGTNYYQTTYAYNDMGLLDKVVSPTGTITRTVYDGQGRAVSLWVGTDDTPTSGWWSPSNAAGMTEVASYQYDNGGVGDGNLTQETDYPNDGSANRVTDYYYDWRDRLVAEKDGVQSSESTGVNRPITYTTYDNLDEATEVQTYDGDGVTISYSGGVPVAPSSSLLRSQEIISYDDQGRVYQDQVYNVDQSDGTVSDTALTTNYYYDHRGNLVAEQDPSGLWTKDVYDGADRLTTEYSTDGAGGTTWAEATSVAGDDVLEQTQTVYDANSNAIETIDSQRSPDASGTGPLVPATDGVEAVVYYTATYYDAADRPIADVDVGTNGGTAWTRPDDVPSRSDDVLVTSYSYNAAGLVQDVTDPMGIVTRHRVRCAGPHHRNHRQLHRQRRDGRFRRGDAIHLRRRQQRPDRDGRRAGRGVPDHRVRLRRHDERRQRDRQQRPAGGRRIPQR